MRPVTAKEADPYTFCKTRCAVVDRWELPDEEEVDGSGVGDWLDQAMAEQDRKNRKLAGMLGDTRESLAQQRRELGDLLTSAPEGSVEDSEPAPDLFEEERAQQERNRRGLSSIVAEERRRQDEERQSLQGLFGPPGKPRRRS
jgi:uncharacterized coiled-coil protein SlyX